MRAGRGAGRRSCAELQARPRATPVLEDLSTLEPEDDLDGCDGVALDAMVVEVSARLASRDVWLGRLLSRFLFARGWQRLGYASEQHYFDERLGMARSTARGRVTLARRSSWLEGLDEALQEGAVGYEQASLLARVANPDTLEAWIARAKARTFKHLREEVRAADLIARVVGRGPVGVAPPTDEELAAVFDFERRVLSGELMADAVRLDAVRVDAVQMSVSQDDAAQAGDVQMSVGRRLGASYPVRARESALLELRALEVLYRSSGRPGTFLMYCVASFWRCWGAGFRVGIKRWQFGPVRVFNSVFVHRIGCVGPIEARLDDGAGSANHGNECTAEDTEIIHLFTMLVKQGFNGIVTFDGLRMSH